MIYLIEPTCEFNIHHQLVLVTFQYLVKSDEPEPLLKSHLDDTLTENSIFLKNDNDVVVDSSYGYNFQYSVLDTDGTSHICNYTGKVDELFSHIKHLNIELLVAE